jgi:Phage-related protein, tail component
VSVNVHLQLNPFEPGTDLTLESGPSIAGQLGVDIASLQDLDESAVIVILDGVRVTPDVWEFIFPADNQSLVVVIRPGWGLGDIGKAFVGVAIGVAAAFTGGLAAAAYGPLWGAMAAAGTMLAGNVLSNALLPQRAPTLSDRSGSNESSSTHLSITGTQNTARPYGPVARIFGRVRRYPDRAAKPYTEVVGENIFYRLLFDWGYSPTDAPLEISQLKIGETMLSEYEGVEIEHSALTLDGTTYPDQDLTLFPSDVHEESLSILLESGQDNLRTGQPDTDESIIDLVFSEGLRHMNDGGGFDKVSVTIRIEYAPTGTENWQTFTDICGDEESTWGQAFISTVESTGSGPADVAISAKYDPQRRLSFRIKHAQRGQYDYRLRRITVDSTNTRTQDKVVWAAIRCVTAEPPVDRSRMEPVARTAMRIKASDELNGVIDKFNGICEARKPVYDPDADTWTAPKTRNAAWAMVDVLHSPVSGHGKDYAVIDLDEFADLAQRCEERNWYFDAVVDYDTDILDLLNDIGDVCRAALVKRFNLWSVVQDKPQTIVRQKFSAKNSWGFRYSRERTDPCHGLRMRFKNEEADFVDDELEVYAEGYSQDGSDGTTVATIFENDECFGVVQPLQAAEIGTMKMAKVKLRPENWSLQTGYEGYVVGLGDLVQVAAVEIAVGLAQGRILSVGRNDSGQIVSVVIDEPCRMETGKEYCLEIRFSDGTQESRLVVTNPLEAHRLEFANDQGVGEPLPLTIQFDEDDYCHFGVAGHVDEDMIVKDINYGQNGETSLEMEHAAPELHSKDQNLPPFHSNVTDTILSGTPAPTAPVIASVVSDRGTATPGADGVQVYRIVARFRRGSGLVPLSGFQVRWRETDGDWHTEQLPASATIAEYPFAVPGTVYEFRIRAVSDKGMGSDWAIATSITIDTGSWDDPAAPVVSHEIVGEWVKLSWQDCKTDWPIRDYVVDGKPLGPGLSTSVRIAWTGAKTWAIKAVDVRGKESAATEHTMSVEPLPMPLALACQGMNHAIRVVVSGDATATLDGYEVWAALINDRDQAALMGMADGDNLFTHPGLDLVDTRYYWCRARDIYGSTGAWYPAGQYAGVRGDTDSTNANIPEHSLDASHLVKHFDAITGPLALEDGIVDEGVVVASVEDVQGIDIRVENAAAAITTETQARITADSALAQRTDTVETTVNGNTATIQQQATSINGLEAEYTIKLDANGAIAGFGLLNGPSGTEAAFLVDVFRVLTTSGGETVQPFVASDEGVSIRGDLIATGSIVGSKIAADAITGDKINSQSLIELAEGGKLFAGSGNFLLDTTGNTTSLKMGPNGAIDSLGNAAVGMDYMNMTGSDITYYRWFNGAHREYKSLKRMEQGWAANGEWVTLPGYWVTPPKIQLSPRNLKTFDADNNTRPQSLNMEVTDIEEVSGSPNVYRFMSNARLIIAAGTVDFNVGLSDATPTDGATAQTAAFLTQPHCSGFTANYKLKANKPYSAGVWHRRIATLRVYVQEEQSGDYVIKASRAVITSSIGAYSGSISVTGLTSSAVGHKVYLTLSAVDYDHNDNGVVDVGIDTFEAAMPTEVVITESAQAYPNAVLTGSTWSVGFTVGAAAVPAQGDGYQWENTKMTIVKQHVNTGSSWSDFNPRAYIGGVSSFGSATSPATWNTTTEHVTNISTPPSSGSWSLGGAFSLGSRTCTLTQFRYSLEWQRPDASLSTEIEFTSISLTLTGANTLAEGTVNYIAIGE